jgi:hypothetical protein
VSVDHPSAVLAPKLEAVLQALPDPASADRLRRVYAAAAQAITRLGDMDLVKYETASVDSSPDLSLWEEMAPVIRDTVMDVNALLTVILQLFPPSTVDVGSRSEREAAGVLREAMGQMAGEITQLGEMMRNPSVVSDRWSLLAEIQRFRATFRDQIGNLVYESASALAEVTRREVVPGYEAEVKASVNVRSIVADLARLVAARLNKVREAEPEDVQWNAQQLQGELDAFGRTAAYRSLRAQDKRRIIEVRMEVSRLALQQNPNKAELLEVMQGLDIFVRSLSAVNQRLLLIQHDREVWAACGVRLEHAMDLVGTEDALAAKALSEAASAAQALYGREPNLDTFLRKTRKQLLTSLRGGELRMTLETFQELLGRLGIA